MGKREKSISLINRVYFALAHKLAPRKKGQKDRLKERVLREYLEQYKEDVEVWRKL